MILIDGILFDYRSELTRLIDKSDHDAYLLPIPIGRCTLSKGVQDGQELADKNA